MQIAQAGASSLFIVQDGCYDCGQRGLDMAQPVDTVAVTVGAMSLALPVYACPACLKKRTRPAIPQPEESGAEWAQLTLI